MRDGSGETAADAPTGATRRDAVDVARVLALLIVVLGHLALAVIDSPDGEVRGANLLALHPGWSVVAALAPMPVFFAAAGWANATATLTSSAPRLRSLVGVGAVVVVTWSIGVVVAVAVTGEAGTIGDGARIATQPLWFIAAYAPLAVLGAAIARAADRHVVTTVVGALAILAAGDVARFGLGAPDWIGWPGFYLAWGVPWVLGAWWRARYVAGTIDEVRTGGALLAVGIAAGALLVAVAGYDAALIDAVDGRRSNTTPPTLYTAVAGIAQVGALLVVAPHLDRMGRRRRRLWDRAGEAAVGVYAWHLTALALCAGIVALGAPAPERLTATWWLTRPLWWAAVLLVTLALVALTGAVRARRRPTGDPPGSITAVVGVALATAGAALVGIRGPRTVELAVACSAAFVAAWTLLGPRPTLP